MTETLNAEALSSKISDPALLPLAEKVQAGERLSFEDGLLIYRSPDLLGLGALADFANRRLHGDVVTFSSNRHINHTNYCIASCTFCAFMRKPGEEGGYVMSLEEIADRARPKDGELTREIHIVGGLYPKIPFDYYLDMIRTIKEVNPGVHVKAFTMVEIEYFCRRYKMTVEEVALALKEAGLDTMPGGGAEIFHPEVREEICDHKCDAQQWLDIAAIMHRAGIPSNCTMLYGHIEEDHHRVDHLIRLRELQDETGGFLAYIPLRFHPANTGLDHLPGPDGEDDLRNVVAGRLMLDNIPHIKAHWIMLGIDMAQTTLAFGANDFEGMVMEERIYHDAGATTPQALDLATLVHLIHRAGRTPRERDAFYKTVREFSPEQVAGLSVQACQVP